MIDDYDGNPKAVFIGCCQEINDFETEFKKNSEYIDKLLIECKNC